MAFERTKFGNGLAAGVGGSNVTYDVHVNFGPRDFDDAVGVTETDGFVNELVIDLKPSVLTAQDFPLMRPKIPALSRVQECFLEVEEVFNVTGTTPGVSIGTRTSEAANGLDITEAQLEAIGMYNLTSTLAGTWAAAGGLTAATEVGIVLTGTTPAVTGKLGRARLVIRYIKV